MDRRGFLKSAVAATVAAVLPPLAAQPTFEDFLQHKAKLGLRDGEIGSYLGIRIRESVVLAGHGFAVGDRISFGNNDGPLYTVTAIDDGCTYRLLRGAA